VPSKEHPRRNVGVVDAKEVCGRNYSPCPDVNTKRCAFGGLLENSVRELEEFPTVPPPAELKILWKRVSLSCVIDLR